MGRRWLRCGKRRLTSHKALMVSSFRLCPLLCTDQPSYIEIMVDPYLMPKGGDYVFTLTGALFGRPEHPYGSNMGQP